jgi:hypothetical protein
MEITFQKEWQWYRSNCCQHHCFCDLSICPIFYGVFCSHNWHYTACYTYILYCLMPLNIYLALSQTLLHESLPVWVTNGSHINNITWLTQWLMVSKDSEVAGDQKLTNHKDSHDSDWCWQHFEQYHPLSFFLESNFPSILLDWNLVSMPSKYFVEQQFEMVTFLGGHPVVGSNWLVPPVYQCISGYLLYISVLVGTSCISVYWWVYLLYISVLVGVPPVHVYQCVGGYLLY